MALQSKGTVSEKPCAKVKKKIFHKKHINMVSGIPHTCPGYPVLT